MPYYEPPTQTLERKNPKRTCPRNSNSDLPTLDQRQRPQRKREMTKPRQSPSSHRLKKNVITLSYTSIVCIVALNESATIAGYEHYTVQSVAILIRARISTLLNNMNMNKKIIFGGIFRFLRV